MIFFIWTTKIIIIIIRFLKLGGGTSLPGLWIEKYFPSFINKLAKDIPNIILISGTNGKTTTNKILTHLLKEKESSVISNPGGNNLFRGIVSTLIDNHNWKGTINAKYAVLEVEEATMPKITKHINPKIIILTNIYRDQLDAYGGIDKTLNDLILAIKGTKASIILNGNDNRLVEKTKDLNNKIFLAKVDNNTSQNFLFENPRDFNFKSSQKVLLEGTVIKTNIDLSTDFKIDDTIFNLKAPGIYNVSNCLLALAAIKTINPQEDINNLKNRLKTFKTPWGRGEIINLEKKKLRLLLIKNPAGFSITLKTLKNTKKNINLMVIINDKIADGQDISWLWDIPNNDLENLQINNLFISGNRAYDMDLRFKYSNVHFKNKFVNKSIPISLKKALNETIENEYIYILPTYTAMLDIRHLIQKQVKIKNLWEK